MSEIISINPATLEVVGKIGITQASKVKEAVAAARSAQAQWGKLSPRTRARYLLHARDYLLDNIDTIAKTITLDNGKPLVEALTAEIYPVAELLRYFALEAPRALRQMELPIGVMRFIGRRSRLHYKPYGVVGVISPWNYPFSIAVGEVATALVAGNAVLLKPSSATPLVGKAIEEMFLAADLPPGVFTHVPGDASTGRALIESNIDKIAFTGSVAAGKDVMRSCAGALIPLVLELGGKDPMIVRNDADIDQATSGAVWGAFTNCGQTCSSVERAYVHESLFDEFVEMATRKALALKVGNGLDPEVDVGPLTTVSQLEHVEAQMLDATSRGAHIHCGGQRLKDRVGYFFPPTVISGVDHSFACVRDETFGPVLPIMPFSDDRQALQLANDSAYGLTASVWTRDIRVGERMAMEISAGTVMINDCVFTHALPGTPWGGCKHSGFGRSHSRLGLMEFVMPHHVHTNRLRRKDMWWYPYDVAFYRQFAKLAQTLTGGLLDKAKALPAFIKQWRSNRA
jgi:succinate-semialdehyde dehydrogenase/glutarate-semialdehyde dehydrogenase